MRGSAGGRARSSGTIKGTRLPHDAQALYFVSFYCALRYVDPMQSMRAVCSIPIRSDLMRLTIGACLITGLLLIATSFFSIVNWSTAAGIQNVMIGYR